MSWLVYGLQPLHIRTLRAVIHQIVIGFSIAGKLYVELKMLSESIFYAI